MAESQDSSDNLDAYSEAANQTETKLIVIFVLELMSGIFGVVLTAMHFSVGFFEGPLVFQVAHISAGAIMGALAILSFVAGGGIQGLQPWAWRMAVAVSIASLIIYVVTPSLLLLALNIIALWYLKNPRVREVYTEIGSLWASEPAQTLQ